jgi:large subunit ribosomal protein L4
VHLPLDTLKASTSQLDKLVPLPASIFAHPCPPSLFHLLVRQHLASLRQGTASSKSRREVNYSNRKIRRQKGTGKARLGDRGSPMLRGGGRAFAKKPKDWSFHVPKKMVAKGLKGALSMRWAMGELSVIEDAALDWPEQQQGKTKVLQAVLERKGWTQPRKQEGPKDRGTLLFLGQDALKSPAGRHLALASRNLQHLEVVDTLEGLKVYDLLRPSRVVLDLTALEEIVARLSL